MGAYQTPQDIQKDQFQGLLRENLNAFIPSDKGLIIVFDLLPSDWTPADKIHLYQLITNLFPTNSKKIRQGLWILDNTAVNELK